MSWPDPTKVSLPVNRTLENSATGAQKIGCGQSDAPAGDSAVSLDARDEGFPLGASAPATAGAAIAFEENARAWLAVFEIPARPVHMRNDVSRWNIVPPGQNRRQARRAVDGGGLPSRISKFADFNSDTLTIAHAAVVGVIALLGREEVCHGFAVIDAKMPHNPAGPAKSRVVSAPFAFHNEVAGIFLRGRTDVLRRMNRYVARPHRSGDKTTVDVGRQ
jgi:hypothetical protein